MVQNIKTVQSKPSLKKKQLHPFMRTMDSFGFCFITNWLNIPKDVNKKKKSS